MHSATDIAWVAGFLEGEGSFSGVGHNKCCPRVSVQQVELAPLEKMQKMFGSKIYLQPRKLRGRNQADISQIAWSGRAGASIMMTIYGLMSPRRQQQIKFALDKWKAAPGRGSFNRNKTHCKRGHELNATHMQISSSGARVCMTCKEMLRQQKLQSINQE